MSDEKAVKIDDIYPTKATYIITSLIIRAMEKKIKVLCCREHQNNIEDSIKDLLYKWIEYYKYDNFFKSTKNTIVGSNGSKFIFHGLKDNTKKIKSLSGIDICYVEKISIVSQESWDVLMPTIRKQDSEIYVTF